MQNDILIFRTSVTHKQDIKRIESVLTQYPQINRWNIDFEDWEKILRIESKGISAADISKALQAVRIYISELK